MRSPTASSSKSATSWPVTYTPLTRSGRQPSRGLRAWLSSRRSRTVSPQGTRNCEPPGHSDFLREVFVFLRGTGDRVRRGRPHRQRRPGRPRQQGPGRRAPVLRPRPLGRVHRRCEGRYLRRLTARPGVAGWVTRWALGRSWFADIRGVRGALSWRVANPRRLPPRGGGGSSRGTTYRGRWCGRFGS